MLLSILSAINDNSIELALLIQTVLRSDLGYSERSRGSSQLTHTLLRRFFKLVYGYDFWLLSLIKVRPIHRKGEMVGLRAGLGEIAKEKSPPQLEMNPRCAVSLLSQIYKVL
jgi:hypothetical protein